MSRLVQTIKGYITDGVWYHNIDGVSLIKRISVHLLRVLLILVQTLKSNRCNLWASALTFYTIFTLVPVIALGIGIAKGFGLDNQLHHYLTDRFASTPEVSSYIFEFANKTLAHTHFGLVAGVGVFVLLWTVIRMIGHIENSFNTIWGIQSQRPLLLKISYYLSILLICPVFLIMSGSITALMTKTLRILATNNMLFPIAYLGIKLIPFVMVWIIFTLLYKMLPKTKVHSLAAIVGGLFAGSLYQFLQIGFFALQVALSKYNAIYGSFSALPLFLIYLYLSWLIVLFGTQISFVFQNYKNLDVAPGGTKLTQIFYRKLYIAISAMVVNRYIEKLPPLTNEEIEAEFKLPSAVCNKVLSNLCSVGVLIEITQITGTSRVCYLPLLPPNEMTVANVLKRCDSKGYGLPPVLDDNLTNNAEKLLKSIYHQLAESQYNVNLNDLYKESKR